MLREPPEGRRCGTSAHMEVGWGERGEGKRVSKFGGLLPLRDGSGSVAAAVMDEASGQTSERTAPARPSAPWRAIATQAALMWLASRAIFAVVTYCALLLVPNAQLADGNPSLSVADLVLAWRRHDTYWYLGIAQQGYVDPQQTAFFPLYPLLIRLTTGLIGPHWTVAALLVSNVAALGAFIGLGFLAFNEQGTDGAWRTIQVTMAYPLAFFLAAPMTESLFIALATFGLFFARRGRWMYAALFVFLAGLARPTAAILVLPLLWEYGRQHGWWRRAFWRAGAWRAALRPRTLSEVAALLGAVPLAFGFFVAVIWVRFGHPLLILNSHRIYWNRTKAPIWQTLYSEAHYLLTTPPLSFQEALGLVDGLPVIIIGLLLVFMVRRLPFAFTLYMLGLLYLTVSTPTSNSPIGIESAGRFMVAAIPAFMLLAEWMKTRPWLQYLLVGGGFSVQAVLAVFFLFNGWIV